MKKLAGYITDFAEDLGVLGGSLAKAITVIVVVVIGLILIKVLLNILKKALSHSKLDEVLHKFILNCTKVLLIIFLIMVVLGVLGISMAPFVTVLGTCGAAVALALKDSLSNFAGGILIIINKPFSRGDYIEVGGVSGKVQEIDLMSSKLVTLDNKVITIPNGLLSTDTVINYSDQTTRRVDCVFGVGYGSDIPQVKAIIAKVIEESNYFISEPAPVIGVKELGDNAVLIEALAWCANSDYNAARYYIQEHVKAELDKAGVDIPFPQLTVHMADNSKNHS